MIIRSLRLRNIRSYEDETIEFPEGTILLSGDIGSGKTTILLAIEFALFGIMKGAVSGNALLRHGKTEGFVELAFGIDGREVIVQRRLKGGKAIRQESGFIEIDGDRMEGTAIELKSKILEIIGYPDELLTKSKSLIYRYTVYTPQEEMKQILLESDEERLSTIRRLFNIDKYKRVKENTINVSRDIKNERDLLASKTGQYDSLKKEAEDKEAILQAKKGHEEKLLKELVIARNLMQERARDGERFEEERKAHEALKKDIAVLEARMKAYEEAMKRNKEDLFELEEALREDMPKIPEAEDLRKAILEKEGMIKGFQDEKGKIQGTAGEFLARKRHSEEVIENVAKLSHCPMCLQDVTGEHKADIKKKEEEKIEKIKKAISGIKTEQQEIDAKIEKERSSLRDLESQEKDLRVLLIKKKNLEDKKRKSDSIKELIKKLEKEISLAKEKKEVFDKKIASFKDIDKEILKAKKDLDLAREDLHRLEVDESRIKTEIRNLDETIEGVKGEVKRLLAVRERMQKLSDVHHWLNDFFFELTDLIEKQILMKVYGEFNTFFEEWFSVLIEDEGIKVRLSPEFSPVIEQDGYETAYEFLSGGEKTAVALAYRLALFRIVNDFMGEVKTKDLIILDEPTDGFSSEQLDRVRDVLEELRAKQIIIVSHEQKMESFVEHVIRVVKADHVSRIS
ncbi:MAG: SMC family ATPase [Nanoarchaeota archaeon]